MGKLVTLPLIWILTDGGKVFPISLSVIWVNDAVRSRLCLFVGPGMLGSLGPHCYREKGRNQFTQSLHLTAVNDFFKSPSFLMQRVQNTLTTNSAEKEKSATSQIPKDALCDSTVCLDDTLVPLFLEEHSN